MESLTCCPICESPLFSEFLKTKDYFLSTEQFVIVQCDDCGFKFLNPRPGENEIARYYDSEDYSSHDIRQKSLKNWAYSIIRNYQKKKKLQILERNTTGKNLLDIGCGTGEFLDYCTRSGFGVLGVEPNKKAREYAIQKYGLRIIDNESLLGLESDSFDIITLWHVLEHIHQLEDRMKIISQILKKEGTLIIAVPNTDSWDAKHYKEFWAAYDVPRHLYHFSQKTMEKLAGKFELKIIKVLPMKFDAFYISLLSEKYLKKKEAYLLSFLNGIRSNYFARSHNHEYSSLIYILRPQKSEN
jgi:2-polyprenyl-3-methyl-5-hydroxy-6-metoxy-1,4-benzoquinol methylase